MPYLLSLPIDLHPGICQQNLHCISATIAGGPNESSPSILQQTHQAISIGQNDKAHYSDMFISNPPSDHSNMRVSAR